MAVRRAKLERYGIAGFGWGAAWIGDDGALEATAICVPSAMTRPRRLGATETTACARPPAATVEAVTLTGPDTQPFDDPAGRFAFSHNGDLRDYRALRRPYRAQGRIHGRADTEVGARWLEDAWDPAERPEHLLAALHDRFGGQANLAVLTADGRPFHYAGNGENPVFSFRLGRIGLASTGIYSLDRSRLPVRRSGRRIAASSGCTPRSPWTQTERSTASVGWARLRDRDRRAVTITATRVRTSIADQDEDERMSAPEATVTPGSPGSAPPMPRTTGRGRPPSCRSTQLLRISALLARPDRHRRRRRAIHLQPGRVRRLVAKDDVGRSLLMITIGGAIIGIIIQPTVGYISDYTVSRWGRRKPYIVFGSLLDVVFLLGIAMGNSVLVLAAFVLLLSVSTNIARGPFQGYVPDLVAEPQVGMASGMVGLMQVVGNVTGYLLVSLSVLIGGWSSLSSAWRSSSWLRCSAWYSRSARACRRSLGTARPGPPSPGRLGQRTSSKSAPMCGSWCPAFCSSLPALSL